MIIRYINLFTKETGLIILFLLFGFFTHAQNENKFAGKIIEKILDSLSGQPMEKAMEDINLTNPPGFKNNIINCISLV